MKKIGLIFLLLINFFAFAQETTINEHPYTLNIGLKSLVYILPNHKPIHSPYLSFQFKRLEVGGLWWRYERDTTPKNSGTLELTSKKGSNIEFINFYFNKSRNWYIGIGRAQYSHVELDYDRITGIYYSGTNPATGLHEYALGHQNQIFEISNKSELYYLSTGIKIQAYKRFYIHPELNIGWLKSKRQSYRKDIIVPDNELHPDNLYALEFNKTDNFAILFGLNIIYKIPL